MLDRQSKCVRRAPFILIWSFPVVLTYLVLLACPLAAPTQPAGPNPQSTGLMEQMDYKQRLDRERAEAQSRGTNPAPPEENASVGLDFVVLVVLACSAAGVLVISRLRRSPRRRRRYPRYYPPASRPN
ncbi:MAG TPA: hypothetical protein VMU02_05300 [bacterium]|nr:hypothetical protein [bacterium]